MNGARKIIGAMLAVAVASGATCANAQTGSPPGAAAQRGAHPTPPHPGRQDTSVVRDVRRALRRVPDLDDSEIHIRVRLGIVTLTGSVPESWQISRAANAARSVHGVRAVTNRLTSHDDHAAPAGSQPPASAN